MPDGHELRRMRELLHYEKFRELLANEEVIRAMVEPDGVVNVIQRHLADLPDHEVRWLNKIPMAQREAMRGVINHVASLEPGSTHLDIQFKPGYDFSLEVFEFSDQIVMRITGPLFEAPSGS